MHNTQSPGTLAVFVVVELGRWGVTNATSQQVTDKDADGVLDEIESAIFQVAASILAGQGFSYRY